MQCDKCYSLYKKETGCLNCFNQDNPYYNSKHINSGLYKGLMSSKEMVEEANFSEKQYAIDCENRLNKSGEEFKKILGTVISQKGY